MKHGKLILALGLIFVGSHAQAGWVGQFVTTQPNKTVQAGAQFSGNIHMNGPCDVDLTLTRGATVHHWRMNHIGSGQYSGQYPTTNLIGGDLTPGTYTVQANSSNPAKCTAYGNTGDTLTVIGATPPPPPPPPVLNLTGISLSDPAPKVGQPVTVTVHGTGRCAFTINDGGISNTGALAPSPKPVMAVGANAVDLAKSLPYSFQLTPGNEGQYTLSANPAMGPGMTSSCSGGAKSIQVQVTSNTMAPKLVLSHAGTAHLQEVRDFGDTFYQDAEVISWRVHNRGNLPSLPAKLKVSCVMEHIQKINGRENTLTRCMDHAGLNQPSSKTVDIPALPAGGAMDINLNGKPVYVAQKRYRACNCPSASCERVGYTGYRVKVTAEILRNVTDPNQADDKVTMVSSASDHEPENYVPPPKADGTFPPPCSAAYGIPAGHTGYGVSGKVSH